MNRIRYPTAFIIIFLVSASLSARDHLQSVNTSTVYVSKILDGLVAVIDVSTDEIIAVLISQTARRERTSTRSMPTPISKLPM